MWAKFAATFRPSNAEHTSGHSSSRGGGATGGLAACYQGWSCEEKVRLIQPPSHLCVREALVEARQHLDGVLRPVEIGDHQEDSTLRRGDLHAQGVHIGGSHVRGEGNRLAIVWSEKKGLKTRACPREFVKKSFKTPHVETCTVFAEVVILSLPHRFPLPKFDKKNTAVPSRPF